MSMQPERCEGHRRYASLALLGHVIYVTRTYATLDNSWRSVAHQAGQPGGSERHCGSPDCSSGREGRSSARLSVRKS
jgi:hypothetical protein